MGRKYAGMAEDNFAIGEILAASRASAAGGGYSELEKAQKQGEFRANARKTTMFQAVSRALLPK